MMMARRMRSSCCRLGGSPTRVEMQALGMWRGVLCEGLLVGVRAGSKIAIVDEVNYQRRGHCGPSVLQIFRD